eukprot:scaffold5121_cov106-Isochrysis_galbana.AAC.1
MDDTQRRPATPLPGHRPCRLLLACACACASAPAPRAGGSIGLQAFGRAPEPAVWPLATSSFRPSTACAARQASVFPRQLGQEAALLFGRLLDILGLHQKAEHAGCAGQPHQPTVLEPGQHLLQLGWRCEPDGPVPARQRGVVRGEPFECDLGQPCLPLLKHRAAEQQQLLLWQRRDGAKGR